MKKVYLITPMKGKTQEEIKAYRKKQAAVVEAILGEDVEIIDSYIEHKPPVDCNEAIWFLSKSIGMMSNADIVAYPTYNAIEGFHGCEIEKHVACAYDIPMIEIPVLPEDIDHIERRNKVNEISVPKMHY